MHTTSYGMLPQTTGIPEEEEEEEARKQSLAIINTPVPRQPVSPFRATATVCEMFSLHVGVDGLLHSRDKRVFTCSLIEVLVSLLNVAYNS